MTKAEFLKNLRELSDRHRERFGYPFLPLGLVRQELALTPEELKKLLLKCPTEVRMTPLAERVEGQLPASLEVLHHEEAAFVSVALVKLAG